MALYLLRYDIPIIVSAKDEEEAASIARKHLKNEVANGPPDEARTVTRLENVSQIPTEWSGGTPWGLPEGDDRAVEDLLQETPYRLIVSFDIPARDLKEAYSKLAPRLESLKFPWETTDEWYGYPSDVPGNPKELTSAIVQYLDEKEEG